MMDKNAKLKGIVITGILVCAGIAGIVTFLSVGSQGFTYELRNFSSYDDILSFLHDKSGSSYGYYSLGGMKAPNRAEIAMDESGDGGESIDYSTTNVQVEGVDEPDIVKTDGTYLYVVANNKVFILKGYPSAEATLLSTISFEENVTISNIFVYNDRLVVFGDVYEYSMDLKYDYYWWGGNSRATIKIYDLTDRGNPQIVKSVEIDGSYFDARMIDNYVYFVATEYTYQIYRVLKENESIDAPDITIDGDTKEIPADQIYCIDVPEFPDTTTHVLSINIDTEEILEKSFLLGSSQTMYVSKNNIFLATVHYRYFPLLLGSESISNYNNEETTILHKISIDSGDVSYIAQGEVPGRILNQFSMDEHNGFFRIATTVGYAWDTETSSSNNIYILDENLRQVSKIEGLAPGESIYAARFMGDRAYLVTFVQVDPLFTIDLSDPYNPQVLGELKIPGYSEYLHPYDENHIIGIGKEVDPTIDADKVHTPGAIYYTAVLGLKIALFDVSDFDNPQEVAKVVIGDRGTDSPVLYDHKAFLFDREKELLVIPVSLYEITQEVKDRYVESEGTESLFGEFTFQGAYVYRLTIENGFEYRGRITHQSEEESQITGEEWYWGYSSSDITRSMYIGNVLYTISSSMVKMNSLDDLSEINSVKLG